jgi:protein-tyrosine-phosphatase
LLARGESTPPVDYPAERYCRNLMLDMYQAKAGAGRVLRQPGKLAAHCAAWAWSFRRVLIGREHHDTLMLDDLRPGLVELGRLFGGRFQSLQAKTRKPRQAGPQLARRFAEPGAAGPLKVLFVCQGNINRSSYAELKARQLFDPDRFQFSSAGMLPRNRRPSPAQSVAAAARHGVDMSAHRSRHATRALLEAADVVIVFDHINLNSIAARYPDLAKPVFLLGEAGAGAGSQILDPEGKDENTFLAIFRQIDACLAGLAQAPTAPTAYMQESTQC